jgi:hypothetical protein
MQRLKVIILYVLFVLAVGCGTLKKSDRVYIEKKDTLVLKTEVIRAPVLNDSFTLKEICEDSVVTEFERIFVRDTDTVRITLQDNSLRVLVSQQERVISRKDSVLRSQSQTLEELKETVRTKWNPKVVLILLAVIVLLWLFPSVPSKINSFVRKLFIGV